MTKQLIKGVTAICLVRVGDHDFVRVECGDKWVDVISERSDGSYCHIVEGSKVNDLTDNG